MARFNGGVKTQNFKYDFNLTGGNIGNMGMGIFLPNCMILGTSILPIADLTSLGAATVDIGIATNAAGIMANAQGTTGTLTDYNFATYGFLDNKGVPNKMGGAFFGKAALGVGGAEVIILIGGFALLTGSFIASIQYLEL